jgi:hypothetical protein
MNEKQVGWFCYKGIPYPLTRNKLGTIHVNEAVDFYLALTVLSTIGTTEEKLLTPLPFTCDGYLRSGINLWTFSITEHKVYRINGESVLSVAVEKVINTLIFANE